MNPIKFVAFWIVAFGLVGCGGTKLGGGPSGTAGTTGVAGAGTGGTAGPGGTGGAGATGGTGGTNAAAGGRGGNCVWANGGGDPQPGPLTCGEHNLNSKVSVTIEGDQLKVVVSGCGSCAGNSLCTYRGDLTALNLEVQGTWATVVDQGLAPNCPLFTAHLLPSSATSEGQVRLTGTFSGADQCHQPLSCPIDELLMVYRGNSGAVTIGIPGLPRCSVNNTSAGSCGGMIFPCPSSVPSLCGSVTSEECAPTWSAALADPSYCAYRGARTFACGAYNVRVGAFDNFAVATYYDAATGAPVAILRSDDFGAACSAGPTQFIAPSCPAATPEQQCPADAGASD